MRATLQQQQEDVTASLRNLGVSFGRIFLTLQVMVVFLTSSSQIMLYSVIKCSNINECLQLQDASDVKHAPAQETKIEEIDKEEKEVVAGEDNSSKTS